jgi:hypothetical protein
MNEWINEQVHERMDELVNERMNKCINECYVVLCCAVLWYGQSAQTFYMCLESLVGCMKGILGSCTYFSADGTILRRFAKYFWADGVFEEFWSTLKLDELMDERMNQRTSAWTNGWVSQWTNEQVH